MKPASRKRVLVAPLDWGMGHATRCVPVIRELLEQDAEVILAADGRPALFLEKEFPGLQLIPFPGYGITYPKHSLLPLHIALRSSRIARKIKAEKKAIEKIATEQAIDIIISDNRFACRSSLTHNVYITHQLEVKSPFFSKMASRMHRKYYDKFDEIWIPDAEGKHNLSGELGHIETNDPFIRYTGPLTRFRKPALLHSTPFRWWLVVLLSGPEPQRSIFEHIVLDELAKFTEDTLIIRGTPEAKDVPQTTLPHVTFLNHADDAAIAEAVLGSHHVLCRPGYSTICDLSALGISPIVVPTPGQPEQEYLAHYHAEMRHVVACPQKGFRLGEAIRRRTQMQPFGVFPDEALLRRRIRSLLGK